MKIIDCFDSFCKIHLESDDWRFGIAKRVIAIAKTLQDSYFDGRYYVIRKTDKIYLKEFLPTFTDEEDQEGEIALAEFMSQFQ